jgi:hypothetical protein
VHLDDATSATVLAVQHKASGVSNIVDDEPAPVSEWLPARGRVRWGEAAGADSHVAGTAAGRGGGARRPGA